MGQTGFDALASYVLRTALYDQPGYLQSLQTPEDLISGLHRHLIRIQEAAAGIDLDHRNLG